MPYSYDLPQIDIEQVRDENIKLKIEIHKIQQFYNIMKVDLLKVENDNKKAIILLEEVLMKSGINQEDMIALTNNIKYIKRQVDSDNLPEINTVFDNEAENFYEMEVKLALNQENENKLKDSYINLQLKSTIYQMRRQIFSLKEEISELKQNEKIAAYTKTQQELSKKNNELNHLKDCYLKTKHSLEEAEEKINQSELEKENLKQQVIRMRIHIDKLSDKISEFEKKTKKISKHNHDYNDVKEIKEGKEVKDSKLKTELDGITTSNNSNSNSRQELSKLEKLLKTEKSKSIKLENTIKELKNEISDNNKLLDLKEKVIKELNNTIKLSNAENSKQKEKYILLENEFKETEKETRELNTKFTDVNEAKMKLEFDYNQLLENYSKMISNSKDKPRLNNEASSKQDVQLEKEIFELKKIIDSASNEKQELNSTITKLEKLIKENEITYNGKSYNHK